MSERKWQVGEFDEYGGYDCMSAGISAGPADLDGAKYGQKRCQPLADDAKAKMVADAHLIAAAPDLYAALNAFVEEYVAMINSGDCGNWNPEEGEMVIAARAALSRARGEKE